MGLDWFSSKYLWSIHFNKLHFDTCHPNLSNTGTFIPHLNRVHIFHFYDGTIFVYNSKIKFMFLGQFVFLKRVSGQYPPPPPPVPDIPLSNSPGHFPPIGYPPPPVFIINIETQVMFNEFIFVYISSIAICINCLFSYCSSSSLFCDYIWRLCNIIHCGKLILQTI